MKGQQLCMKALAATMFVLSIMLMIVARPELKEVMLKIWGESEAQIIAVTMPYAYENINSVSFFEITGTVEFAPINGSWFRLRADDCVREFTINGKRVDFLSGRTHSNLCYPDVVRMDLKDYLHIGSNSFYLRIQNTGGAYGLDFRPIHTTPRIFAVLALLLSAYIIWKYSTRTQPSGYGWQPGMVILSAIVISVAVWLKWQFIDFKSNDFNIFLTHWVEHIRRIGLPEAYAHTFNNYAPLYPYMLGFSDWLFALAPKTHVVKFVSFAGEAVAAWYVFRIVRLFKPEQPSWALICALALPFLPTVMINGSMAAQCDIVFTAMLLATFYYMVSNKPVAAMIAFGLAFSLKQQALFFAPFITVYMLRGNIPIRYGFIVPAVYIASCLPNWLAGRSMLDMLLIYWGQFNAYATLGNAANIYQLIPHGIRTLHYSDLRNGGMILACMVALGYLLVQLHFWKDNVYRHALLLATLSVFIMPFFLPKMLDRYFFTAEIFAYALACVRFKWLLPAILLQVSGLLAYPSGQVADVSWFNRPENDRLMIAVWSNIAALCVLVGLCLHNIWCRKAPAHDSKKVIQA